MSEDRFSKGDRVLVRACGHLVGTVKKLETIWGKPRYLIDVQPRGGPIYCEEWELEAATALDELASQLDLDG
jgi:hypothetical protein